LAPWRRQPRPWPASASRMSSAARSITRTVCRRTAPPDAGDVRADDARLIRCSQRRGSPGARIFPFRQGRSRQSSGRARERCDRRFLRKADQDFFRHDRTEALLARK
jgi:hypothetical protein